MIFIATGVAAAVTSCAVPNAQPRETPSPVEHSGLSPLAPPLRELPDECRLTANPRIDLVGRPGRSGVLVRNNCGDNYFGNPLGWKAVNLPFKFVQPSPDGRMLLLDAGSGFAIAAANHPDTQAILLPPGLEKAAWIRPGLICGVQRSTVVAEASALEASDRLRCFDQAANAVEALQLPPGRRIVELLPSKTGGVYAFVTEGSPSLVRKGKGALVSDTSAPTRNFPQPIGALFDYAPDSKAWIVFGDGQYVVHREGEVPSRFSFDSIHGERHLPRFSFDGKHVCFSIAGASPTFENLCEPLD